MVQPLIVCLDFDGVLCDSAAECYISSSLAWTGERDPAPYAQRIHREPEVYRRFLSFRPFIRSGEDYVLVQKLIHQQRLVSSQQEFDELLQQEPDLKAFKESLYGVRSRLLLEHQDIWMQGNPLYSGWPQLLSRAASYPNVVILSTKRPAFIRQVLAYNHIDWPEDRLWEASGQTKRQVLEQKVPPGARAVLLDDQGDYLFPPETRFRSVLALWGYVAPAYRDFRPAWTLSQAQQELKAFLDGDSEAFWRDAAAG